MKQSTKIAVVGGGISGITTAICLYEEGFDVWVYEASTEILPDVTTLSLFPNATRVFKHLQLYAPILSQGQLLDRLLIRNYTGKRLKSNSFRKYDPAPVSIKRADLHQILLAHFPAERVLRGYQLQHFEQRNGGVTLHFTNGESPHFDVLIGADGLHSTVRTYLKKDPLNAPLRYSGYAVWRGVCHLDRKLAASETWGNNQRAVVLPLKDNAVGWWLTAEEDADASDLPEGTAAKLARLFENWHEPIPQLIAATPVIAKQHSYDRNPTEGWWQGKVVIIGDAAHPCTPTLGQGGCSAIEDAAILTRCLAKYDSPEKAFAKFESIRFPRTRRMVQDSRFLGMIGQWSNPIAVAFRNVLMIQNRNNTDLQNYDQYFDYDALAVEV